ncbi:MAG: transglutaminase-like domain-containing protein [Eubacteriales bacterium]
MKKTSIIALLVSGAILLTSCSMTKEIIAETWNTSEEAEISIEETDTEEVIEKITESTTADNTMEVDPSEVGSASYNFYDEYNCEPLEFNDYEDYYDLVCFMLINNIELYEFTLYNPSYKVTEVQDIINNEMVLAYDNATLVLNSYTDMWSHFEVASVQTYDEQENIADVTYTFKLSSKSGIDNEQVRLQVEEAELLCEELINEMYLDGRLENSMSNNEKAYALYQWCGENLSYQYETDSESINDNFYQAITTKTAVCQGITGLYIHLCRLVDIPMYIQLGYTNDIAHSWCKVETTSGWLYIDPTWAITDAQSTETYSDTWFMVTQEFMETYPNNTRVFEDSLL